MVTLHPAVSYLQQEGKMKHTSRVFVSDKMGHKSRTVFAIMRKLVTDMKAATPGLMHIHYYTDSPLNNTATRPYFTS